MKSRALWLLGLGFGAVLLAGVAWGFWSGTGSGSATVTAATLIEPAPPTLSASNGTVTVIWTAATAPGVGTLDYSVQRRDALGTTWVDACGTTAVTRIAALTCNEVPGAGRYVWRVQAFFASWTATSAESAALAVPDPDLTPPTGSITAPYPDAFVRASMTVSSDSADAGVGVASARFEKTPHSMNTWTTIDVPDTTAPYTATWDTTAVTDGLYDLRVVTIDNVGNSFTSPIVTNVRVDNTAPTLSVVLAGNPVGASLAAGRISFKGTAAGSFGLVATVTDGGSGAASATFPRLSASGWTTHAAETVVTPAGGPYVSTAFVRAIGASAPGPYTITAADAAGNTVTIALTFAVDSTLPTGSVTAPAAAANVRGNAVSVTSSSADSGSGVARAQFQTSPAGTNTWSNLGAADTAAPYAATWDTTTFTDGLYDLRVITTDNAGNVRTSATIASVRVDNTAPTGTITAPLSSANVRATVTVTSNSADAGSGVLHAQFQTSPAGADTWSDIAAADTTSPYRAGWATTSYPDGLYDLRVVTTDKAGNTFTSVLTTAVQVDNTAPAVSVVITAPTGAHQVGQRIYFKAGAAGSFSFLASVADAGSGPASVLFPALSATGWAPHAAETVTMPAGGPYTSATFSWSAGAAAPGAFTITAADISGNTTTSVFTFTVDNIAPTGSVTAPAAAADVRGSAVSVTSSSADAGSGVASAQFQTSPAGTNTWSNLGAADTAAPYAVSWDTTTFTDGRYDLRVITTDNLANTFTSAPIANVRVDNTPPTGAVTAPAANAFVNGASVAVSANSADAGSGVSSTQFQTSPSGTNTWTNLGAADTTSPYGVTWNTTSGYPDGRYDLRVITTDKAGNTFTSPTTTVEVQNRAPVATAIQLVDVSGTMGMIEEGDSIIVTYSQTLRVSTLCSAWSDDLIDQSLSAAGNVVVTVADGGVSNDTLTVTSGTCTFHFGTVNLGATGYVTSGNQTFSGSAATTNSTIAWNATTHTLTITLGQAAGVGTIGTVASSNATYTPDSAIKNGVGTAITGTLSTGLLPQF